MQLHQQNKLKKASVEAQRAYDLARKHLPPGHEKRKEVARLLGTLLLSLQRVPEAQQLLRESGDVSADPSATAELVQLNNLLAMRLQSGALQGLYEFASKIFARATQETSPDSDVSLTAATHLGKVHEMMGEMDEAFRLFENVLRLQRRKEFDPSAMSSALMDVARLLQQRGRHGQAEPLLREALTAAEQIEGGGVVQGLVANQLGFCCERLGKLDEALQLLKRSLHLRQEALGADHPQVVVAWKGLATVAFRQKRYQDADAAFETAWRIQDRALGSAHPETVRFLVERAASQFITGRSERGLELLRSAEKLIATAEPGPATKDVADMIVKLLQTAGAEPEVDLSAVRSAPTTFDFEQQRPGLAPEIHRAVIGGNLDLVRSLLSADPALLQERDAAQWTPLHCAAEQGRLDIARFLLEQGADVQAQGQSGETPLHLTSRPPMVRLLLEAGANPRAEDRNHMSPLAFARIENNKELLELLASGAGEPEPATTPQTPATEAYAAFFEGLTRGKKPRAK